MQINRLFEIIYILLNKKSITAKELAEHFEVSVRTIYRDIDTLSIAGIPIYTSQGKGGGISLLDHYVLDKSLLSEQEQKEILYALQSLTVINVPDTNKVLSKISNLFNKNNRNWIEVDFSPWGSDQNRSCQFTMIKDAILNFRIIEFLYMNNSGEKSIRRVEPMKLLFKEKAWYLQGFCLNKETYRTFKITRMSELIISNEAFIERDIKETIDIKETENPFILLILNISSEGAYRVYEEFDKGDIRKNEDGSFTINTSMPKGEWIYSYLLSYGSLLEVKEPMDIRLEMKKRINLMINKYFTKT